MTDRLVRVRDNGVRSFVPPSFCFDLVDAGSGDVVATVSRVVLDDSGATDHDAVTRLTDGRLLASGRIGEYAVSERSDRPVGLEFRVLDTVTRTGSG